ncbi:hypothetical protein Daus18300_000818 [Diaporthe australafricana]|uniref:SCP domain-containing protein n=1 Tax=Diaporthe australafricana TaxID=127596 RepID=A0ABR3Y1G9_9PEZI
MLSIMLSIFAAVMLAAGVLAQPVVPTVDKMPQGNGKDGALLIQNFYRNQAHVPALAWSQDLVDQAQIAVDWIAAADMPNTSINFTARSSENSSYSIQVAYLSPGTPRLFGDFYETVLAFWAGRLSYHGEVIPDGDFFNYSAYTQMMWSSTRFVGMAGAQNRENGTFVVAAYSPAGNIFGEKPFNGTINSTIA